VLRFPSSPQKQQQALYAPQKKNRRQGRAAARDNKHTAWDGGDYI
jgi:hypothetical protein